MSLRNLGLAVGVVMAGLAPTMPVNAQPGGAIDCESRNYAYQRCEAPWGEARIARQTSGTQCVRGQNWGFDRRGGFVWVDRGCGARFVAAGGYGGRPDRDEGRPGYVDEGRPGPGPGWDNRFTFRCESNDSRYNFCAVDLGGGGRATLLRQTSNAACIEGRTWGWNRAGVWIQGGCRGEFTIERRWR